MYISIKVPAIFEAEGIGGEPSSNLRMVESMDEKRQASNVTVVREFSRVVEGDSMD